jgi:hypothetical protein
MKTFKQFNEEAQYHLDEVDRMNLGLGMLPFKVAKFVGNQMIKKPIVYGAKKAYGAYKGIKNFIDKRPNTTKYEIDQINRDTFPTKETK